MKLKDMLGFFPNLQETESTTNVDRDTFPFELGGDIPKVKAFPVGT